MNPERSAVDSSPQIPGGFEYQPVDPGVNPEVGISHEQAVSAETAVQAMPVNLPAVDPATIAVPQPLVTPTAEPDDAAVAGTGPAQAADEDLIEKEWVDKVKRIILLTRGDPYQRNRVIAQLQADYLKKRYNKTFDEDN